MLGGSTDTGRRTIEDVNVVHLEICRPCAHRGGQIIAGGVGESKAVGDIHRVAMVRPRIVRPAVDGEVGRSGRDVHLLSVHSRIDEEALGAILRDG